MRLTLSRLILGYSAIFSLNLQAQTLSWDQCVAEASRNNAAIQSARSSWQASSQMIRVAQSNYYPQVSANFTADYGENYAIPGSRPSDSYAASISVTENIFNGWADQAQTEQNKADASIAESTLQITKSRTAFELKSAFANLIYAQRAIRLQENIRDRRRSNLSLVDLRFENGAENRGSVLLSKAYLDQAELNIIQARNSIQVASSQLARAMGRDGVQTLTVSESVPTIVVPKNPDYRSLALTIPQRQQAILRERSAETSITLAKAGYFPTLGVSGSYGRQDDRFFPEDQSWSVGVVLNVPIYSGGRDYHSIQSAIESRTAASQSREDLDRELVAGLSQAMSRLIEAKKSVEVAQSFLKASEMRAEIGRGRYNNGLLSFDDWDVIESDLINRQQTMILSQRDYVLAEAAWENALGTGSIK